MTIVGTQGPADALVPPRPATGAHPAPGARHPLAALPAPAPRAALGAPTAPTAPAPRAALGGPTVPTAPTAPGPTRAPGPGTGEGGAPAPAPAPAPAATGPATSLLPRPATPLSLRLVAALTVASALLGVGLEMWVASRTSSWVPADAGYRASFGPGWEGAANRLAYFTGQSNLLVAASALVLACGGRRGRGLRILHLVALLDITVTGVVYVAVLAGPNIGVPFPPEVIVSTSLEHVVTPLLAWACWLLAGPMDVTPSSIALAVVVPLAWAVLTLVRGALVDWYPYPFLDVPRLGLGTVLGNVAILSPAFPLLGAALMGLEHLLGPRR